MKLTLCSVPGAPKRVVRCFQGFFKTAKRIPYPVVRVRLAHGSAVRGWKYANIRCVLDSASDYCYVSGEIASEELEIPNWNKGQRYTIECSGRQYNVYFHSVVLIMADAHDLRSKKKLKTNVGFFEPALIDADQYAIDPNPPENLKECLDGDSDPAGGHAGKLGLMGFCTEFAQIAVDMRRAEVILTT